MMSPLKMLKRTSCVMRRSRCGGPCPFCVSVIAGHAATRPVAASLRRPGHLAAGVWHRKRSLVTLHQLRGGKQILGIAARRCRLRMADEERRHQLVVALAV